MSSWRCNALQATDAVLSQGGPRDVTSCKISNRWNILTLTPARMLEVFPLNQIADVGAPRSEDPKLISREIIFEVYSNLYDHDS